MSANFVLTSSQRLILATPAMFQSVNAATFMAWIRPVTIDAAGMGIVALAIGPPPAVNSSPRFQFQLNGSGQVFLQCRSTDGDTTRTFTGTAAIAAGRWTHVAGVVFYGTSVGQTYIDGVLDNAGPFSGTFAAGTTSGTICKRGSIGGNTYGDAPQFNGLIEDVRGYGRGLGPDEIQTIFASGGVDGIVTGGQGRWPLKDRGPGQGVETAQNIWQGGPNGQPVNGVLYDDSVIMNRRILSRPI